MAKTTYKKGFNKTPMLLAANVLVILGLLGATGFYYKKYHDIKKLTPEQLQQQQVDAYTKELSKVYSVPNEKPASVATVQDKDAVKKQYPALDQAENGDVVFVYKDAKLAILYRPSEKKVIKSIPVTTQLSIRTVGSESERQAIEKTLTDNKVAFTSGGNSRTTLSGITVVDLKGDKGDQAKQLADLVKGKVGSLPAGEDKPNDIDLLVLVGPAASAQTTDPAQAQTP